MLFLELLLSIILPIFLLMGLGFVLDRALKLDLTTLSRLVFYVLIPAAVLNALLRTPLAPTEMLRLGSFALVMVGSWALIGYLVFSLSLFKEGRPVYRLGMPFTNGANYGIPLMLLAFGDQGVAVNAILLVVNMMLLYSAGILGISAGRRPLVDALKGLLSVPSIYVVPLGVLLVLFNIELPQFIGFPLKYLGDSFVPIALLALGAQMGRIQFSNNPLPVIAASLMRLLAGPAVAFGLAHLFQFDATLTAMVTVAASVPVAVSVFVIASEYDIKPEEASEMVFFSTLISAITVPLIIVLVRG